jgi:16S rRNA (guanine527-N7)-methyltransferase
MDTARIAALLEPFIETPLSKSQLDQISIYIDLLQRWNARINLTAIRNEEEIVTRHFGESFFMARHLFPTESPGGAPSKLRLGGPVRALDIGSGAGFPALPLKIWDPSLDLTLVESNHKKAAFLREVARALTLTNINVINDRVEVLVTNPNFQVEVVTLRAVERFENILPHAAALLAPSGTLALLIGTTQIPNLTAVPTMEWQPPLSIPKSHSRVLSIGILR